MDTFEKDVVYEEWAHDAYQVPFFKERGWELLHR